MNQYYQVNWINGMKINSGHFIELENHFISRIQNSTKGFVNDLSYGLLPSDQETITIPQFSVSLSEKKIRVIRGFSAFTREGYLVQIPAGMDFPLSRPSDDGLVHFLVLNMKPYVRMPFGEINEQESPSRFPYSIAECQFSFLL